MNINNRQPRRHLRDYRGESRSLDAASPGNDAPIIFHWYLTRPDESPLNTMMRYAEAGNIA
jgi:hypothetical protein